MSEETQIPSLLICLFCYSCLLPETLHVFGSLFFFFKIDLQYAPEYVCIPFSARSSWANQYYGSRRLQLLIR